MTKKHFDALAAALHDAKPCHPEHSSEMRGYPTRLEQWRADCSAVADACARFAPKFNRARFLGACEGGA